MADSKVRILGNDAFMDDPKQDSIQDRVVLASPRGSSEHTVPGRGRECETLDRLISELWVGEPQMLVVRGEEGVGKTDLLDYLGVQAVGCRVVRAAGVESERHLSFAGLHQLCAPLLGGLDQLPEPQRQVLEKIFGERTGEAPDRFVVGMAVMGLLNAAATDRPLVCILKHAQWLDDASSQTLGFVARRFVGGPVAMVISVCDRDNPDLTGVPELAVPGLSEKDALALLRTSVPGLVDPRVQERIATEAQGNPRVLRLATDGMDPDQLAGGFGLPRLRVPSQLERRFRRQLAPLPAATKQLLLVAAAEPTGDAVLLWSAANQLGISADAAAPAEAMELVELNGHVRFCHPFVRSVIYQGASRMERRRVHRVLGAVTDPDTDPDRRAWHRAQAAPTADDQVASELERTADQAQARGGLPAGSAFRARAAELTVEPDRRARRALAAASMSYRAGSWGAARRLLAMAQAGPLDDVQGARAQLLDAQLHARSGRGSDTAMLLLAAASRLAPLSPGLARTAYGDAFCAALSAGRLGSRNAADVASAVRAAPVTSTDWPGLLLEGASVLASDGHRSGAPLVKEALQTYEDVTRRREDGLHWLPLACRLAQVLRDDKAWQAMSTWLVESVRKEGALSLLPEALNSAAVIELLCSGRAAAVALADEAEVVGVATRNLAGPYGQLMCAAWGGSLVETARLIDDVTPQLVARGEGAWISAAHVATAVVNNGAGRYNEALVAAEQVIECPEELALAPWSAVELIEAAVRVGAHERAAEAVEQLTQSAGASGTDWALGILDRSRALLRHQSETAELLYQTAIERLGRTLVRGDLARAHLVYGEWLRRRGRRVEARQQLHAAHETFIDLGFDGFAERARRELLSTGASLRKQPTVGNRVLTDQEAQIARLARDGRTNSEIGVELYLSPRTVEWHLGHVFMKLRISSRRELGAALPSGPHLSGVRA